MSNNRDLNFNPTTDKDRDHLRKDLSAQYQVLQVRINETYEYMARVEKILGPRFETEVAIKEGEPGYLPIFKAMSCWRMWVNGTNMMERTQLDIMEKLVGPDFEVVPETSNKDTEEARRKRRVAEQCLNALAQKYTPPMVPPNPPS